MRKLFSSALAAILLFLGGMVFMAVPAFAHTGSFRADCTNLYFDGVRFPAGVTTPVTLTGTVGGHDFTAIVPLVGITGKTNKDVVTIKTNISQWTPGQTMIPNAKASWVFGHKQQSKSIGPEKVLINGNCTAPTPKTLLGHTSATSACVGNQRAITVSIFNDGTADFRITAWTIPFTDAPIGPLFGASHGSSFKVAGHTSGSYGDTRYTVTVESTSNDKELVLNGTISGQVAQCPKPITVVDQLPPPVQKITTTATKPPQLAMTGMTQHELDAAEFAFFSLALGLGLWSLRPRRKEGLNGSW